MKHQILSQYLAFACLLLPGINWGADSVLGDIRFTREDQSAAIAFPPSIFPHWKHRIHYRCDACHDSLFPMKQGATQITMEMINDGEVCGTCHNGSLAFDASFTNCATCHQAPAK